MLSREQGRGRRLLQVVSDGGGLGDQLARLAALRECLRLEPLLDVRWFVAPYMHPVMHATIDLQEYIANGRLQIFSDKEIAQNINPQQPGLQFSKRHTTPSRHSLFKEAMLLLADSSGEINGKWASHDYVKIDSSQHELVRFLRPFVVVTTNFTTKSRSWPVAEIQEYIEYLIGLGKTVVLLGSTLESYTKIEAADGLDTSKCIDLRNQTTLLQAHHILERAEAVVGVDNGLVHLAACSYELPRLIVGYTTIDPLYRKTGRRSHGITFVVPDEKLECRFCQSKYNMDINRDFRECMYGDYKCVEQMTAQKFIDATIEAWIE